MHKHLFFTLFLLLLLPSCSPSSFFKLKQGEADSAKANYPHIYTTHIIEVDENGCHKNRSLNDKPPLEQKEHFNAILKGIDNHIKVDGKKKLLIFFHGGLNSLSTSLERGLTRTDSIMKDGIYPIFFNWDCSGLNSYFQHVFSMSSGINYVSTKRPFYQVTIASDLLTGMARSPISAFNNTASYLYSMSLIKVPSRKNSDTLYDELHERMTADVPNQVKVEWGKDKRGGLPYYLRGMHSFAVAPSRLAGGLLLWDGLGTPAWVNMKGRAHAMFHPTSEFDIRDDRDNRNAVRKRLNTNHSGILAQFMDTLVQQLQVYDSLGIEYEITVIGHSMGAIITNNLLREYPQLEVKNIVHMAGASSIREVKNCVVPYLQKHPCTRYYNLTLHPYAEVRESLGNTEWLVPRGTLLVHIDNTFERPFSYMDRTSGRWENIIQATHLFPDSLRGRITIKSFDILNKQRYNDADNKGTREQRLQNFKPQKHGQFGKGPFWDERFWQIEPKFPRCKK